MGVCCMVYGVWCRQVYDGVWCMVYGVWCMVFGNGVDVLCYCGRMLP